MSEMWIAPAGTPVPVETFEEEAPRAPWVSVGVTQSDPAPVMADPPDADRPEPASLPADISVTINLSQINLSRVEGYLRRQRTSRGGRS